MTKVAGILLAAGGGSRLGHPKATVELDGATLAERGVALLRDGGTAPVLVVTGAVPVTIPGTWAVHNADWASGMGSSLAVGLQALISAAEIDRAELNTANDDTPQNDSLENNTAENGTAENGTAENGTAENGTAENGTAENGTAENNTAENNTAEGAAEVRAAVIALADQPLIGAEAVRRLVAAWRAGATVAVATYDGKPRNPVLLAREHWPAVLEMAAGDTGARPFLRAHPDLVTLVECGDTGSPYDIDTPEDIARVRSLR